MLPDFGDDLKRDFTFTEIPGKTYGLDFKENCIRGFADGLEAVRQSIYSILNSERMQYEIYSWDYGVEVKDLAGLPPELIQVRLERTITDALMQDDRIISVSDFKFTAEKSKTHVTFKAGSSMGEIETGWIFDV